MQVINRYRLRDFWTEHPRSEHPLRSWFQLVSSHDWDSTESLQATFPNAELHESLAAFSIEGGTYYLITSIDYQRARIFVRDVQLYTQFRTGEWRQLSGTSSESKQSDHEYPGYAELVSAFPLRPIHDDEQLRQAAGQIDSLLSEPDCSQDAGDYLEVLTLIIAQYERKRVPIPPVSGNRVLRALVTEHRLTMIELIPLLGNKARANAVMREDRPLNLRQVSRASRYFALPPESFMDPDDLEIETRSSSSRRP